MYSTCILFDSCSLQLILLIVRVGLADRDLIATSVAD